MIYRLAGLVHDLFDHCLLRLRPQSSLCSSRTYDRWPVGNKCLIPLIRIFNFRLYAAGSARRELGFCQRYGQPCSNLWRLSLSFPTKSKVHHGIFRNLSNVCLWSLCVPFDSYSYEQTSCLGGVRVRGFDEALLRIAFFRCCADFSLMVAFLSTGDEE